MFRMSRWMTVALFSLTTYALWVHLFSSAVPKQEISLEQELASSEEKVEGVAPYTQYRQGLRRDLYEGKGAARRHAFYTAEKAQMVWQETKKECEERLVNCFGVFDEEGSEMQMTSPHAICLSRPMTLILHSVECVRREKNAASKHPYTHILAEKAIWSFPKEDPWRLQTEGMQLHMRRL